LTKDEADYVQRKLIEFADRFTKPRNFREIGVALRDSDGNAVGGITASTVWDWLQIGILWIPEEMRGRGYGSQLLERIEQCGRECDCRYARLNTFDFEARGFYEAHGHRVVSQTDDFPSGHTQFHLTKEL
jgi:GNAT superfamily N-acetyltransferase